MVARVSGATSRAALWSAAALAGAALLLVAGCGGGKKSASSTGATTTVAKTGGTYVVELTTDVDYTDPGLDYLSTGWEIQYAVGCKLLNYPDKNGAASSQLVPEVAAAFPKVTDGGKTYTFTIRKGYRFNTGEHVTAQSFADALNRDASPQLQSPAQAFLADVVGAEDVFNGRAKTISGVVVSGDTLAITLVKPGPDLLARLAMPFFQAIDPKLAHDTNPNGVETPASCGPYHVADRIPNNSITIQRNPYYTGPRPHNVTEIDYKIGNSQVVIQEDVSTGTTDYAASGIPPTAYKSISDKYGVNKERFWVEPQLSVQYLAMNTSRPLFKDNVKLRQAVNWAISRGALLSQGGYYAGVLSDQILPPGMPGFKRVSTYPLQTSAKAVAHAQALAKGNTRGGKAILWTSTTDPAPLQAQIYQQNLKAIGLDVQVSQFARAVQIQKEGVRGAEFDFTTEGWAADYADPYDFVNVLLDGTNIKSANNNNVAYFDDPNYNRQMADASLLFGDKRYSSYATLDANVTTNAAPWAARANSTNRIYVSGNSGCFTYNAVFGVDLTALCLK
jgi:ABC-type oligopeptide transport system substrate-binding subunit